MRYLLRAILFCAAFFTIASCVDPGETVSEELRISLSAETVDGALLPAWDSSSDAGMQDGRGQMKLSHLEGDIFAGTGTGIQAPVMVYSPFDEAATFTEEGVSFSLPDNYIFTEDRALPHGLALAGAADGTNASMRHLLGYLDLPVCGGDILKAVQFTSLDPGSFVSGTVTARRDGGMALEGQGKSVSVSFPEAPMFSYSDTLHILIPVPEQTYHSYEIAFETEGDPVIKRVDGESLEVQAGKVTKAAAVVLKTPRLLRSFRFRAADNPGMKKDVVFGINNEMGLVFARIKDYIGLKSIAPYFELEDGASATVNGVPQVSGESRHNFYHPVTYEVTDRRGFKYSFTVKVDHFTGLPVMIIDTPGAQEITSKEVWLEGTHIYLDGVGIYDDYETVADDPDNIRGRGNATWNRFQKKGYNIKLGKKASLLGMPKHKRWCLMANYRDRIKIRNDIAFYIANGMGAMGWNPHGEFVEIILNGRHIGMYEVVEQIKIDDGRVNVTELETDENDIFINLNDETITGGYVFMIDAYFDEEYKFRTTRLNLPVEFKDPNDNITSEMMTYAQDLFNEFERRLTSYDFKGVYEMIDMDSFIDFWILNDLVENDDAANAHSDFIHKDRGGKLIAGPVWDFDSFTWRSPSQHFNMRGKMWYPYLLKDKAFCRRALQRWNSYRDFLLTVPQYAEQRCSSIERSESYDAALWWPIVGNANNFGDEHLSFREALTRMKTNFAGRFTAMEAYLSGIEAAATYDSSK